MDLSKELQRINSHMTNKTWKKFLVEVGEIIIDESSELPEVIGGRIKRLVDKKLEEIENVQNN